MHLRHRTWVAALALFLVLSSFAAYAQAESITVQPGDTLKSIAARVGTSVDALVQANNLANPDLVQAGQTLVVPERGATNVTGSANGAKIASPASAASVASAANTSSSSAAPAVAALANGRYVVRVGDTLYSIAARYGTTAAALIRANGIGNPDFLAAGTVLSIPQPGAASAASTAGTASTANGSAASTSATASTANVPASAAASTASTAANTSKAASPSKAGKPASTANVVSANPSGKALRPDSTRFVVSISQQHCWLYQDDVETGSWPCSTGRKGWGTATGTFHVKSKIRVAYGSTWNFYMPYWLGIYTVGSLENGIHGLPFQGNFHDWGNKIGTPISFGCVVLQDAAAKKVYEAASIGMPVIIKR